MKRLLLALVLAPVLALADDEKMQLKIQVGHSKPLNLGGPAGVGTCDDTSIVKVEAGEDALKLTGLKVGKTLCGFWKQTDTGGGHTVVEITVTADDPDAPAKK